MRYKYIIIALAGFLVIGCLIVFTPISINKEPAEVEFRYMAYACGDCYPQYKVEGIQSAEKSLGEFLEKEVRVVFSTSELEKLVDEKGERCMICCRFFFTGYFQKSIYRGTFFKVEKASVEVMKGCCSN